MKSKIIKNFLKKYNLLENGTAYADLFKLLSNKKPKKKDIVQLLSSRLPDKRTYEELPFHEDTADEILKLLSTKEEL